MMTMMMKLQPPLHPDSLSVRLDESCDSAGSAVRLSSLLFFSTMRMVSSSPPRCPHQHGCQPRDGMAPHLAAACARVRDEDEEGEEEDEASAAVCARFSLFPPLVFFVFSPAVLD